MGFNFGNFMDSVWDVVEVPLSIIPGVGPYLSGKEANETNTQNVRDTNAANLQATRETNALNERLWREQTAYNTPTANMQRLREAGLSPQLAYGQVAESRMASAPTMQAPSFEAPKVQPVPPPSLSDFQQVVNMQAANKLTRAQTEKVQFEAARAEADASYAAYENKVLQAAGTIKSDTMPVKTIGRVGDAIKSGAKSTLGAYTKYIGKPYLNAQDRLYNWAKSKFKGGKK